MKRERVSEAPDRGCRELAVRILQKVEDQKAYANILLDQALRKNPLARRDQALLTELVYGTLRWQGRLDWHLNRFLHLPLARTGSYLRNLLRISLYQILFLTKIPDYAAVGEGVELAKKYGGAGAGGMVNGVLRNILREKHRLSYPDPEKDPDLYLSAFWSHPEWLVRRWIVDFGRDDIEELLSANNQESPLVLRAQRLKIDREGLLQRLRAMAIDASPTRWSPQGVQIKSASAIYRLPGFEEGLFQIQGEASQLVGFLVDPKPGERILDACAAPGGKTTHLVELMQDKGQVMATDLSMRGLEKLKESMRRLNLRSIRALQVDMTRGLDGVADEPFDRILLDAPCSGLGTLRSHPEAKWQRTESDIRRLARLQKELIQQVASYLKPGGILVYSTCTLTPEENEGVVEDFLKREKGFLLEDAGDYLPSSASALTHKKYYLALPHKHGTDGFFGARLRKVG